MEYRGKRYSLVQVLGQHTWKWSVDLDGSVKSGKALSRETAIQLVEHVIDRAMTPKRKRLVPPGR